MTHPIIVVIDFGESRIRSDDDDKVPTMKTGICGTPGFMDPMMEFAGEGFQPNSDLWSLGITFYYILFGELPNLQEKQIRL